MMIRSSSTPKLIAIGVVFCLLQLHLMIALAAPGLSSEEVAAVVTPQASARLQTRNNQPVKLNGNDATTGATVPSGSTIETGDGVGATVNIPGYGTIHIAPNTKVLIEYSNGQMKVTVIQGCLIAKNNKGVYAQIYTEKGFVASNDEKTKPESTLDICFPSGAPSPIVNQGAAANAGAGAGAAGGGLSPAELALIFGGIGLGIGIPVALHRGGNPSGGTP